MRAWRPLGFLATGALLPGCATGRAFTPAVSVEAWAQPEPPSVPEVLPGPQSLVERWQLPATSPWAPWVKLTLLAALPGADLTPALAAPMPPLPSSELGPPPPPVIDDVPRFVEDGLNGHLPPPPPPSPQSPSLPSPFEAPSPSASTPPPPASLMLSLPDVTRLEVVHRAQCAAERLATEGLPPGVMLVADVRGAGAVAFGATLSQRAREPIAVVPTFNNWPAENEVIPAEETLAALATMQPRVPQPGDPGAIPVFLLDAWRLAYPDEQIDEDATDNRYMLTPADLPDAGTLLAQGVRRVVYVVESLDDAAVEEDDLHATFQAWQEAGVELSMVDLQDLCRLDHPTIELLVHRRYRVVPRPTLLDSPAFFERARGGFGGVHAGPSPFRPGLLFHGGGGG